MHHPLDELAGACMGVGAILVALLATRAYGEAVRRQAARERGGGAEGAAMSQIAVIAHTGKTLGGGLEELRAVLGRYGVIDPLWLEVPKSRKAPKAVRKRARRPAPTSSSSGAATGWCQRCVDVLAGHGRDALILPAGTANLLATNLGIPQST